jgi:hypothetical protein
MELELLTRQRCPLCDEGAATARRMASLTRTKLRVVDVDTDPELAVDYGLRVPVVRDGSGSVLAEGHIHPWRLLAAMIRSRVGSRRSR